MSAKTRRSRDLERQLRFAWAVLRRFRTTLLLVALLFGAVPLVYVVRYPAVAGHAVTWLEAVQHVYFLHFGNLTLPPADDVLLVVLNLLIPPVGLATVVDGVVRFSYVFNARKRADREWTQVIAESLRNHVIVCGAGRVGYRVATELKRLGRDVVVIEKNADAPFASVLRDEGTAVLIDDVRGPGALERTNVRHAEAVVCATDDDLANLNIALDARKLKPDVRVVIRLFDPDLVEKVRDNFEAEAHSTSALAAPALALAALDPRIMHSFHVGEHLMVVSKFVVNEALRPLNLSALRDRFGGFALSMKRGPGPEVLHPQGNTPLALGDELVVQCRYVEYLALREFAGETKAPLTLAARAG